MAHNITLCLLSPEFVPVWGGLGSYTIELIKHLPENIDIHLVTLRRKISGIKEEGTVSVEQRFGQNLSVHYVSTVEDTLDRARHLYHLYFQTACLKEVPRLHRKYHFDIMQSCFPPMSDILLQLLTKNPFPVVCTLNNTIKGFLGEKQRSNITNSLFYHFLSVCETFYLKRISRFIAISNFIRKEFIKQGKVSNTKIETVYHGVDTSLFSQKDTSEIGEFVKGRDLAGRPIVLFSGRLVSVKGINTLIRSIPNVVTSFPDVFFLFAGAGRNALQYIQELKRLGITDKNYAFCGLIDYFHMPMIYSLATIYVAPSLHESLGLSILEAMSCEKPVIATRVGGICEIIKSGYNGILFPPHNSKQLSESLIRLLEDSKFRRRLGAKARRTVIERFSAQKMAAKTVKVYEEVLSAHAEGCG